MTDTLRGNLFPDGTIIYNRELTEKSKVVGYEHRRCACGKLGKFRVQWPDGKKTLLCPFGLKDHKDGFKIA